MLTEALGLILGGADVASALAEYQQRRQERIELQTFLTDFRLTWDALRKPWATATRCSSMRTSCRAGTLLLFGPDQLTPPPIVLPNRTPSRDPRRGEEGQ